MKALFGRKAGAPLMLTAPVSRIYAVADLYDAALIRLAQLDASIDRIDGERLRKANHGVSEHKRDHLALAYPLPHQSNGQKFLDPATVNIAGQMRNLHNEARRGNDKIDREILPDLAALPEGHYAVFKPYDTMGIENMMRSREVMRGVLRILKTARDGHDANEFGYGSPQVSDIEWPAMPEHAEEWLALADGVLEKIWAEAERQRGHRADNVVSIGGPDQAVA